MNIIQCITFNNRKDLTKTVVYSENGKPYQKEILEEHCCICSEPGGKYLFQFLNNPVEKEDLTHTEHMAQLFEWITENQLVVIGGDSTNLNTGLIF